MPISADLDSENPFRNIAKQPSLIDLSTIKTKLKGKDGKELIE
jgi:hypothetical protein